MNVTRGALPKLHYSRPSPTALDNSVLDGRKKPRCWDWATLHVATADYLIKKLVMRASA